MTPWYVIAFISREFLILKLDKAAYRQEKNFYVKFK